MRKAIGDVQQFRKEMQAALVSYEQALELFRAVGDRLGEANVRKAIGLMAARLEQYEAALNLLTEAYELYQSIRDNYSQSITLYYRSLVYEATEDNARAIADMRIAVDIVEHLKLPWADEWRQRLEDLQEGSEE